METTHETHATLGCRLIGPHALAALYHPHCVRDATLLRGLPRTPRSRAAGTPWS
ncbi:hypothetical protein [Dokdonella sp.]|uniref:hypothetical protein n=1 Tax=Dokdonella sp. TaxID=2291710 RepID=UPI0031C00C7C|nr:hypothetical protein [Dokdonella sp.]